MEKRIIILIIFFFSITHLIKSQVLLDNEQFVIYKSIPKEKLFVHYNATLLFSGEYLYYKIYNLNSKSKKLSLLSKIAYIELIDSNTNIIFKHKIYLKSGMGQGDFFISSKIPSGNYKLIAYTKWMLNSGNNYFYKADVSIINPYSKNQNFVDNNTNFRQIDNEGSYINNIIKNRIKLELNKKQFSKREPVSFKIKALDGNSAQGNYSISVKKMDTLLISERPNSVSFNNIYSNNPNNSINNKLVFLPELRGELITGKILNKNTNLVAANIPIGLSISGKDAIFKISNTNESGIFHFNLYEYYKEKNINFIIMNEKFQNYKVVLNKDIPLDYSNIKFGNFKINETMETLIIERSIANQIENAYYHVKQNITKKRDTVSVPFYKGLGITYNLDSYKRFPTVKETIIEIINELKIQKVRGEDKILIKRYVAPKAQLSTLIIVDGLVLINHSDLIDYDARQIKTISIIDYKYRYGDVFYDGIIAIETINNNFGNYISNTHNENIEIIGPLNDKSYFQPDYANNKLEKIPDYRTQLLWQPSLKLNSNESVVTFYTSDLVGTYEINIEGFTLDGYPVSIKEPIIIK